MRITHVQIDEIMSSFERLKLDENSPSLPFNVKSLQHRFNAQIKPFLDAAQLDAEGLALMQKLLLINECQIHTDEENNFEFFVNIFGDTIGLFGLGTIGGNFKILRLCFTVPENDREAQTLNFVFHAFTKSFLPKADGVEFINLLKATSEVICGGVKFSLTQKDNLLTVTAVADAS